MGPKRSSRAAAVGAPEKKAVAPVRRGRSRSNSAAGGGATEESGTAESSAKKSRTAAPTRRSGRSRSNSVNMDAGKEAELEAAFATEAASLKAVEEVEDEEQKQDDDDVEKQQSAATEDEGPGREAPVQLSSAASAAAAATMPANGQELDAAYADYPSIDEDDGGVKKCPYLSDVNRKALDFDMQKVCSVTLSNQNVYCCLVCGKFFGGRARGTPVHTHSVQCGHFVFVNLHSTKIYCLPDDYEVLDSSLDDIKYSLSPSFTSVDMRALEQNESLSRDVSGTAYLPGFVGMNNLNCTDYINAALHTLAHVQPVRDFFLVPANYAYSRNAVVHKFGEVMRKLWSCGNFKSTVSPHDFVHAVNVASKGRFRVGQQAQVVDFFGWLLNMLHRGLLPPSDMTLKSTAPSSSSSSSSSSSANPQTPTSIIHETFQGLINVVTLQEGAREAEMQVGCMYLTLNIPPMPLFKAGPDDSTQATPSMPEIPLYELLKKVNGTTWTDTPTPKGLVKKRYELRALPRYLILNLERFVKTQFALEKNSTVVTFPVKNLDMRPYLLTQGGGGVEGLVDPATMDNTQLRATVKDSSSAAAKRLLTTAIERSDLEAAVRMALDERLLTTKYDLVGSICHDSSTHKAVASKVSTSDKGLLKDKAEDASATAAVEAGSFKSHLCHKATGQWFELQDLHVTETMPQLVGMSESNILVYERKV